LGTARPNHRPCVGFLSSSSKRLPTIDRERCWRRNSLRSSCVYRSSALVLKLPDDQRPPDG
jgi:hypothetical protein